MNPFPAPQTIDVFDVSLSVHPHRIQHRHPFHEFYYSLSRGGLQFAEDREYPLEPGQFFTLPAGVSHLCTALDPLQPVQAYVIFLHEGVFSNRLFGDQDCHSLLEHLVEAGRSGEHEIPMELPTSKAIGKLLQRLCQESKQQAPGYQAFIRGGIQQMMALLLRDRHHSGVRQNPPDVRTQLSRVFQFIHANYMEPLTVEEAASVARLSRSHFHALFHKAAGMTFVQYLNGIRLHSAENLLRDTDMPIIEVAFASGFGQLPHFYRCFKSRFGSPPAEYRRNARVDPGTQPRTADQNSNPSHSSKISEHFSHQ